MKTRILGWDIIRFFSFAAIVYFHFTYWLWYLPHDPNKNYSLAFHYIEIYARSISFSGFTILLLSSALWGFAAKRPKWWFYIFVILASFTLSYMDYDQPTWSWDIYALILVGFITLVLIKHPYVLALVGLMLLWIPFWQLREQLSFLPQVLTESLIGICEHDRGDWPLFPWIGLIWFGYGLGQFVKKQTEALSRWHFWREGMPWGVLLFSSLWNWGPYFATRNGPGFSCDMFTQPPHVFWSHMIWVLFLMRLSLLVRVRQTLDANQIARWFGQLMISKKFWAAYFIHLVYIYAFSNIGDQIRANQWVGLTCMLLVLPLTEVTLRIAFKHFPARQS